MARRFNLRQRILMFLRADGRCENCGQPLGDDWHGDHRIPFSHGGRTTDNNGQALCPKCNRKKGNSVTKRLTAWTLQLRDWQEAAYAKWLTHTEKDFLAVATPGAGKTCFACRCAHYALESGEAQRIVVVCPSDHLKRQWQKEFAKFGIQLDADWGNGARNAEARDYHGVCVTYATVGIQPDWHKQFADQFPTMVIADEIHHAGESLTWGDGLQDAFGNAHRRLLLSGTPFRTDNNPIPFVNYQDGRSKADFTYGYGNALSDDVCRPVIFPHYEGRIEWVSGFDIVSARFADRIAEDKANERLRMALSAGGEWLSTILREANDTLTDVRREQPNAGGLIVAMEKSDARAIAKLLDKITGEYPTVVLSDEPESSQRIDNFSLSNSRWIVAVKMVSEGVDIKRLRVGVYATRILTELYFRQVVGRFVRVQADVDSDQTSYIFLPADQRLLAFAHSIKEERDHQLRQKIEEAQKEAAAEKDEPGTDAEGQNVQPKFCEPLNVGPAEQSGIIADAERIPADCIKTARQVRVELNLKVPDYLLASVIHRAKEIEGVQQPTASKTYTVENTVRPAAEITPLGVEKKALRKVCQRMLNNVHFSSGIDRKEIGYQMREAIGGKELRDATKEELQELTRFMQRWIDQLKAGH